MRNREGKDQDQVVEKIGAGSKNRWSEQEAASAITGGGGAANRWFFNRQTGRLEASELPTAIW
jgi:hypothetical protein